MSIDSFLAEPDACVSNRDLCLSQRPQIVTQIYKSTLNSSTVAGSSVFVLVTLFAGNVMAESVSCSGEKNGFTHSLDIVNVNLSLNQTTDATYGSGPTGTNFAAKPIKLTSQSTLRPVYSLSTDFTPAGGVRVLISQTAENAKYRGRIFLNATVVFKLDSPDGIAVLCDRK